MNASSNTVRVFIRSTFNDMQADRDRLVRLVLPAKQRRLYQGRCRLDPIDSRVRVEADSKSARQNTVLDKRLS